MRMIGPTRSRPRCVHRLEASLIDRDQEVAAFMSSDLVSDLIVSNSLGRPREHLLATVGIVGRHGVC